MWNSYWNLKNFRFLIIKNQCDFSVHHEKKCSIYQLFEHFFFLMMCASFLYSTLRKISDMFSDNNVVTLFSFFQTVWIWLNNQMIMISVNLLYHVFIYYDDSMSCFLIIKQSFYIMIIFIILLIVSNSIINLHELNFW